MVIKIKRIEQLHFDFIELQPLIEDSKNQGIFLIQRLVDDWISGTNCFNREGEILLGARDDDKLVGLCGLNLDPYHPVSGLGRVRHLYVLSSKRRQGIGTQLIKQIIQQAQQHFDVLNLRTTNSEADKFYLAQGFRRSYERPECTHILNLRKINVS